MGVHIEVIPTDGLPPTGEPISSFSYNDASLINLVKKFGYQRLDKIERRSVRCTALLELIEELDKEDSEIFTLHYFLNEGKIWGDPKQRSAWQRVANMNENAHMDADKLYLAGRKKEIRKIAFRFFGYNMMGYEFDWEY